MTDVTACLGLPLLAAGQAQKEMLHNEALVVLDALVAGLIESVGDTAPPASPASGGAWIVGAAPSGDWSGHAGDVAIRTDGGWRFVAAREGLAFGRRGDAMPVCYRDGAWRIGALVGTGLNIAGDQVVGARQAAIADPAGGSDPDAEARAAIGAILVALRSHGLISG